MPERPPDTEQRAHHPSGRDLLLVAAGGSVGTFARHLISLAVDDIGGMPAGILLVNLSGAFLLCLLLGVLARHAPDTGRGHRLRLLLGTGVLGGYTTYSALAADTAALLLDARVAAAAGYATVTLAGGLGAGWLGIVAARTLRGRR